MHTTTQWLEDAGNGDQNAWANLHVRYRERLIGFLASRGIRHADAEDAVDRMFARLPESAKKFKRECSSAPADPETPADGRQHHRGSGAGWLMTAVFNEVRATMRLVKEKLNRGVGGTTHQWAIESVEQEFFREWETLINRELIRLALQELERQLPAEDHWKIQAILLWKVEGTAAADVDKSLARRKDSTYQAFRDLRPRLRKILSQLDP